MKWLAFTSACVAALIALGILAVDERDVVWEGRQAVCPYCRAELPDYAVACQKCRRTFDWSPAREPCSWCLGAEDARLLRQEFEELELEEETEPLPGALAEFPIAYFRAFGAGKCAYCGGIGKVTRGEEELDCPVCFGDGNCIACAGSRTVLVGDEGAHRRKLERERAWEEAHRRSEMTHLKLLRERLFLEDVRALRGYVEAEELVDAEGAVLVKKAKDRVLAAFAALEQARKELAAAEVASVLPEEGR
jgi:hypothetical protein